MFTELRNGVVYETASTADPPRVVATESSIDVDVEAQPSDSDNSTPRRSGYHMATRDHPFLDMTNDLEARVADARIMAGYAREGVYPPVFLDLSSETQVYLTRAVDLGIDELRNVAMARLALILGSAFGLTGHQMPYDDPESGYYQVELIRKSVPSGGSRHPVECFINVLRAPSDLLVPGLHQFSVRHNAVALVADPPAWLSDIPPTMIAEADLSDADFVMTVHIHVKVDRAMFRYRDPRSFRALLVDAGHVDAQVAAHAAYCNWRYRSDLDVRIGERADNEELDGPEIPRLMSGLLEGWGL